jgi:C-terminal processing protease CtpA/Prc
MENTRQCIQSVLYAVSWPAYLYRVKLRRGYGEPQEVLIESLTLKEIEANSRRRYEPTKEAETKNIALHFSGDGIPLLKIKEFADWRDSGKRIRFSKALKKVFQEIDSSRYQNLIIDLRDNDGGDEKYSLLLFSYLTDIPFTGYRQIDFRTTRFSFRKLSSTSWIQYMLLKTMLNHKKVNDSTYLLTNDRATSMHVPNRNSFKGRIYVLINRGTFSAASDFAALVHSHKRATFVGEETGGSYLGNTSNYSFVITLPNTKIRLNIPIARYQTNVMQNYVFGRGTIPDHAIQYSIEDVLQGSDREMEATLRLIEQ